MAKTKKSELTLEELQAKKSETQRGWVRFCAILLAVLLTVGIYGVASRGEPNVVKLRSGVVRTNTQTVVKQEPTVTPATTPDTNTSNTTTPPASDDEGGGILETIMNLLGGIDFSKITGMLDFNGLGVKVADGIDKAADSLLTLVDKIEGSITKKPVITHEAEEAEFAEGTNVGDAAVREAVVDLLNNATAKAAGGTYTLTRNSAYTNANGDALAEGEYGVSIGEATETVNSVLGAANQSLDTLVGAFNGVGDVQANVVNGAAEEVNENYLLMATQLKADDIAVTKANIVTGEYMFALKNVANPNRMADCGLTRMTNDYLVQNELAPLVAGLASTNNNAFSMVKLSDLEMNYTNIYVSFKVNPITGDLVNLSYTYASYGKFTVRTNTLQVVGAANTTTTATYSDFVY